jgi:hypothetical protein
MRLLACFAYFFRGQRILPWVAAFGAADIALGFLVSGSMKLPLTALGLILIAGFPILVGGLAYRQLIANRRTAVVPDLRFFATGALFLLALFGAALAAWFATLIESRPNPWPVGLLAFALISLYLVISQWLITYRSGAWLFVILPFVVLRVGISSDSAVWEQVFVPWAWLALAGLAWFWLALYVRGEVLPRNLAWAGAAVPSADAERPGLWRRLVAPGDTVKYSTPTGTLLRGSGDGWFKRVAGALTTVLLFPVVMSTFVAAFGVTSRNPIAPQIGAEFFLGTSLLGYCIFPALFFAEWPTRLRLLWLRIAGDRLAFWRQIERSLLRDLMLVAIVGCCVAAAFLFWSDVQQDLVYIYLVGSILASFTGSYLGILARVAGWHGALQTLLSMFILLSVLTGGAYLRKGGDPFAVTWLLPPILVLAIIFRREARSRFLRIDWCKVRPLRMPRRPV